MKKMLLSLLFVAGSQLFAAAVPEDLLKFGKSISDALQFRSTGDRQMFIVDPLLQEALQQVQLAPSYQATNPAVADALVKKAKYIINFLVSLPSDPEGAPGKYRLIKELAEKSGGLKIIFGH